MFSSVTLTWTIPAGCPGEAEVLIEVARVLDAGGKDRVAVTAAIGASVRSSIRIGNDPSGVVDIFGFRCARGP